MAGRGAVIDVLGGVGLGRRLAWQLSGGRGRGHCEVRVIANGKDSKEEGGQEEEEEGGDEVLTRSDAGWAREHVSFSLVLSTSSARY